MDLTSLINSPLNREREDHDVDVVAKIEKQLTDDNHHRKDELLQTKEFQEAKGKNSDLQIFLIKKVLRNKLCDEPNKDTRLARYALETAKSPEDFMKNVKKYVLPLI